MVVAAVVAFALGMAFAHLRRHGGRIDWPSLPSLPSVRALPSLPLISKPATPTPTLRTAIEPIYKVLFGPLDDRKAVTEAVEETAELNKLLPGLPSDAAGNAARSVLAMMNAACKETARMEKSNAQPTSGAFGGGSEASSFFSSVFDKRWRTDMAALAAKAAPEWKRFVDADAAAPPSPSVQSAISTLLAERHLRDMERTALAIEGDVLQVFRTGALVSVIARNETVFITGITGVVDNSHVVVLAHPDGTFQYSSDGTMKTVRQYRFFRVAEK